MEENLRYNGLLKYKDIKALRPFFVEIAVEFENLVINIMLMRV